MKCRLKKKVDKAEEEYWHGRHYSPRITMHAYYQWQKYLRKYDKY